jgi:hypothetical protein
MHPSKMTQKCVTNILEVEHPLKCRVTLKCGALNYKKVECTKKNKNKIKIKIIKIKKIRKNNLE